MRVRNSSLSVLLVGVMLAFALSVAANSEGAAGPDPHDVYIETLSYGGSGCPQGTVGKSLSDDRTTLTLIFDRYVATLGPDIPITENRKNCQLNVKLHFPQGWSYSIVTTDFQGFVQADHGVHAQRKSTYYFAGQTQQVSTAADFFGPITGPFLARDYVGVMVYSPCGASESLNINAQVRLFNEGGNSSARAQISNDSIDGKFNLILGFQWRRC